MTSERGLGCRGIRWGQDPDETPDLQGEAGEDVPDQWLLLPVTSMAW